MGVPGGCGDVGGLLERGYVLGLGVLGLWRRARTLRLPKRPGVLGPGVLRFRGLGLSVLGSGVLGPGTLRGGVLGSGRGIGPAATGLLGSGLLGSGLLGSGLLGTGLLGTGLLGTGRFPGIRRGGPLLRHLQGQDPRLLVRHRRRETLGQPAAPGQARRALQGQFGGDRAGGGPLVRVLRQAVRDQLAQLLRYGVEFGLVLGDPAGGLLGRALRERGRPGRRVRQEQPQHEQVGGGGDLLALDLLGRQIAEPHRQLATRPGLRRGRSAQRAEGGEAGPVGRQQHRAGGQALEHGPGGVHPGQDLGDARAQYPQRPLGQRTGDPDRLGQRQRGDVTRRRPQGFRLVRRVPGVQGRGHPAAREAFGRAGLGLEAAAEDGDGGQLGARGGDQGRLAGRDVPGHVPYGARALVEAGQRGEATEAAWIVLTQRLHGAPPCDRCTAAGWPVPGA
ncbi:hypothetical protein A3Q37_07063 [Streptomyces sp. PTY087I2]|nr:hypothetical protein A3Q37_07063 [Streptomyces sp. PTY087I2]